MPEFDPTIVLEMKLHPPPLRTGLMPRASLLDTPSSRVVVCAPAGYGKTTILAQYAAATPRPLAWLSLGGADNDPALLLLELATCLARLSPVHAQVFRSLRGSRPAITRVVLPGLVNALGAVPHVALILDDMHLVEDERSVDIVAFLCDHVPPGAQLLIASREASRLPLGRLRTGGDLLEIGPRELAFGRDEVDDLLQTAGVPLGGSAITAIIERAEGWPAAIALAALALGAAHGGDDGTDGVAHPAQDRNIVDYLSEELLSRQPPDRLAFLLRTSVLERLSVPLCNAVLERDDSASMIAAIEAANLFLLPLDRVRGWYRYHHLFRDVLRADLARRDAGAAEPLHRRAAEWYMRHGRPEEAVRHALAGRDVNRAAEIVVRNSETFLNTGRQATARRWVDAFSDADVTGSASLALSSALTVGFLGETERARRYVMLAEHAPWLGPGAMGESSRESALALTKALFGWEGVGRMRAHAAVAYRLEPAGRPAHESAALAMGCSLALLGRTDEAVPFLEEATALGSERGSVALIAHGELARLAFSEGRTDESQRRVREGLSLAERLGLDEQTASILLHATASLDTRSDKADALAHLERALRLLPQTAAFPWLSIEARVVLGRAAVALGDLARSESLLHEARRELLRFPDAGALPGLLAREERSLHLVFGGAGLLAEPLTMAERRVLALLPTYLSLEAIGQTLHISRNTVKAHLKAVYRKLDVDRRSRAVEVAQRHGLVDRET